MLRLLLLCAALLAAGCDVRTPFRRFPKEPPGSVSWHVTPRAREPQRVAVLPFATAERVGRSAAEVAPAVAASMRELGLHEVVLVGPDQMARLPTPTLATGALPVDTLLAYRDATGCDAVLIGRIEQFDGFHPLSLGLTAHLVSCQDGAVLWSANAHLDGKRDDVQRDIEGWWTRTRGDEAAALGGWRSVLASPREFARYAADRLAWSVTAE
jgi:nucleotide-binding universal stress UspA family protein